MAVEPEADEALLSVIEEVGGAEAVKVTLALMQAGELTDEEVALKADLNLLVVRKLLYKLFDNQLALYRRASGKDGLWYTYYWRINKDNLEAIVKLKKRKVLEKLRMRLNYERSSIFFNCPNHKHLHLAFEEALEKNFKCPKCQTSLNPYDNKHIIKFLEERIKELEKEM